MGKSSCPVHFAETYTAVISILGDPEIAAAAGMAVCEQDLHNQGDSADQTKHHAMGGRKPNGDQQTPCQVYDSTKDFVNSTDDPNAATHAIQDSYPLGHQYQLWSGGTGRFHLPSAEHRAGDSLYLPDAEAATEQYWQDLLNGHVQDASAYLHPSPCL